MIKNKDKEMRMKRYCIDVNLNHWMEIQRMHVKSKKWMIKINRDLKLKLKIRWN